MSTSTYRLGPAAIASGVRELVAGLDDASLGEALDAYALIDGIVDAARLRRLAQAMTAAEEAGQDPLKAAKFAASLGGKCSRRAAEAAAKRACVLGANETIGERLESGDLTPGQVDNIAHAMQTDPSAGTDQELIDRIAERSVDQGRRVANDWATEKTSAKDLEDKHKRERRNRSVRTYWSANQEAMALTLYGDRPTIESLLQRINAQERIEYRNDGGRDVRLIDHPRTREQRRFDAAVALLLATATPAGGRPAVVISIPWSKLSGKNPDACAEQVGYGPIPDSVAREALLTSDLFVNITGLHGQTMWWGRTRRLADRNQFISLVLRDKGCVLCGSDWQTAESHHLMPSEAPGKGCTDIDNLALVCSSCHHGLHDKRLTLMRDAKSGQWLTRRAAHNEIAPRRPAKNPPPDPLVSSRQRVKRRPVNERRRPRSTRAPS